MFIKINENIKALATKSQYVFAVTDSNKLIFSSDYGNNFEEFQISKLIRISNVLITRDNTFYFYGNQKDTAKLYKFDKINKLMEVVFQNNSAFENNFCEINGIIYFFQFGTKETVMKLDDKYKIVDSSHIGIGKGWLGYWCNNNIGFAISGYIGNRDVDPNSYNNLDFYILLYDNNAIMKKQLYFSAQDPRAPKNSYFIGLVASAGDSNWLLEDYDGVYYLSGFASQSTYYDKKKLSLMGYNIVFVNESFGYSILRDSLGYKISFTKDKGRNWEYDEVPKDIKRIGFIAAGNNYSFAFGNGYILRTENITSAEDNQIKEVQIGTIENIDANNLEIKLTLSKPTAIEIQIVNTTGAVVQKISNENLSIGEFSRKIDISNLTQGTYFLQIIENNKVNSNPLKFVKMN